MAFDERGVKQKYMMTFFLLLFIVSGATFIIQTFLGLTGISDDLWHDGDGIFGFFTVRNVIAFLLGFSSSGYLLLRNGSPTYLAIIIGVLFGFALSGFTFLIMRALMKLQQESVVSARDYQEIYASVTIRIGANRKSVGKVEFTINERLEEMAAVTDEGEDIAKGMQVQVIRKLENGSLLVKK